MILIITFAKRSWNFFGLELREVFRSLQITAETSPVKEWTCFQLLIWKLYRKHIPSKVMCDGYFKAWFPIILIRKTSSMNILN